MNVRSNFNRNSFILISISVLISLIGKITGIVFISFLSDIALFVVAVLCGPWAGFLAGTVSVLIYTGGAVPVAYYDSGPEPIYRTGYPQWLLYAFIGFVVGILAQKDFFKKWWTSLLAGYATAVAATFLFIILGHLFDKNYAGFVSGPQIGGILMALPAAMIGVFNSLDTNFPVSTYMVYALITFGIIRLPISQWKTFIQGCPQSEAATASETKPNRIIYTTGIILILAIVIYLGYLLILAGAVGAFS